MHKKVKKYADSADIKGLKYIFVDCLDADPTFEDYRDDFEYCRNIPGLFEEHMELTPFCNDSSGWDEDYWIRLKKDLLKNFSMKRFQHMRKVAEIFYKEKIYRIQEEREAKRRQEREKEEGKKRPEPENQQIYRNPEERTHGSEDIVPISKSEQQRRDLKEKQEKIKRENQQIERQENEQRKNIEKQRKMNGMNKPDATGKKALGVVLVIIIILIIILLIIQMA